MYATLVLTIAGVLSAGIAAPRPQDPPPPPPPVQPSTPPAPVPQTPVQAPPVTQAPASQSPATQAPAAPEPAAAPALTAGEIRQRRDAIYLFEGTLIKAVELAAQHTVTEIRRIEPAIVMFSASPVRAHGTYLEGYGVFFHVEIPSVIPSVASLLETLARNRMGPGTTPAQPTAMSSTGAPAGGPAGPMLDPDAHYVQSVKAQLINAMIRQSNSMDLRPDEWLAVEARDGSTAPGQLSQPSTMNLRIKGSDLADFFARRITIEEASKRVQVRGF